jgi:Arm DNA-binding domain
MKLTYAIARALMPPAGKLDHIVWDEGFGGFGVRIRAGGKRIRRMWIYQYDFAGRTRRISLGNVEAISLQDARQTASELHAKIRLGHDPASEKAENRLRATVTFGAMVADYLPRARAKMRPRSYADVERHLLSYCKPLHGVPLEAIARRDVAHLFSTVTENHGKGAANNMLYALSAFLVGPSMKAGPKPIRPAAPTATASPRATACSRSLSWLRSGTRSTITAPRH